MKRKVNHNGDTKPTKKGKANDGVSQPKYYQSKTKLKASTSDELMQSMLGELPLSKFLSDYWEKKPLHVQRKDSEFYGGCFVLDSLYSVLDEEEIQYETDINVCRYIDGTKEMLNSDGKATKADIKELFEKEGATIQFHQPQRFSKELWHVMEKMENFFGNLVGANVYITPPNSKGLAPHYDDVEVFIIQLEGSKKWKLHAPQVELPLTYSEDLQENEIGPPAHEITMEPGDLLYFPRGTIHHAEAQENHSTHITISTYQSNSWGNFLSTAMSNAIETAMEENVDFRRGLPINFCSFLGTCLKEDRMNEIISTKDETVVTDKKTKLKETDERVLSFKATLKELVGQLIDHIDPHTCADLLSEDFIASRLPPMQVDEVEDSEESPTLESSIQLRHTNHIRLVVCDSEDLSSDEEDADEDSDDEMEDDGSPDKTKASPVSETKQTKRRRRSKTSNGENGTHKTAENKGKKEDSVKKQEDEEEEEDDDDFCIEGPFIKLAHSLNNEQHEHMIGEEKEPVGIKFPLHFGKALYQLLNKTDGFTPVKEFPLNEEDKLHLATSLWSEGLVNVKLPKEE